MQKLPIDFVCPQCGSIGSYCLVTVDYHMTVGDNMVIVPNITLEECTVCHEQLTDGSTTDKLTSLAQDLKQGDTSKLVPIGTTYRASV